MTGTPSQGRLAASVGAGILVTRLLGFVRERVFAHYFGDGPAADAFRAALRIPNVIRNLLGEGTLSASFIPVYAAALARGDDDGARKLASVVASFLVIVTAAAALAGVFLAPLITDVVAFGFSGPTRDLTITLVEIMFPMSGAMILSAWCLGVLNTHRRFFLSYAAPALWNIAQIATLVTLGAVWLEEARLIVALAWGALVGAGLQVAVQVPAVLRLAGRPRWTLDLSAPGVLHVLSAWGPVVVGQGVYQISSVVDTMLASTLEQGAVAILGYAQLLAMLPVSLFGVSVAAAALPELARDVATADVAVLRARLADGARRVAYFAIPAAAALAALSTEILGALFQTGRFGPSETVIAASVLAAYAIAIPAQASVKLFASGHYAFGDTRTPVAIAAASVAASAGSAFLLMQRLGPAGIGLGAAVGGWLNVVLNAGMLSRRTGRILDGPHRRHIAAGAVAIVPATLIALGISRLAGDLPRVVAGVAALGGFGLAYGVTTLTFRHPEAVRIAERVRSNLPRRS